MKSRGKSSRQPKKVKGVKTNSTTRYEKLPLRHNGHTYGGNTYTFIDFERAGIRGFLCKKDGVHHHVHKFYKNIGGSLPKNFVYGN